ncbi:MAG: hypothetical protein ACE5IY_01120 [bacterium]
MGHRELLLTIAALMTFSLTTVTVNRLSMTHADAIYGQQAEFVALSLAQRFVEEAKLKAFDESTINSTVTSPAQLTLSLGAGGAEGYPNVDDVDDFNGLTRTVTTAIGPMEVSVQVNYVDEADLSLPVAYQTFYKKLTVRVDTVYLPNLVQAQYVFAYKKN